MAAKLRRRDYASENILVSYDLRRCIHAEECVRGLPSVFDTQKQPWIQPDEASADQVAATVLRCPTGALHFERKDGGGQEPTPEENLIFVVPDGPLYVRGEINVTAPEGHVLHRDTRIALCRCGASRNKPFCDNTHLDIGFQADGSMTESLGEAGEFAVGGVLEVIPTVNGSYHLRGNLEVRGSENQTVFRADETWLCRCGGSGNKPFCDGTHRKIGFAAGSW